MCGLESLGHMCAFGFVIVLFIWHTRFHPEDPKAFARMSWMKVSTLWDGQIGNKPGETCRTERKLAMPPAHRETTLPCASPLLYDPSYLEKQKNTEDFTPNETQKLRFSPTTHLLLLSWVQVIPGPVRCCSLSKHVGSQSSKICQSEERMRSGLCLVRRTSYFSETVRMFLRHYRCWTVQAAVPETSWLGLACKGAVLNTSMKRASAFKSVSSTIHWKKDAENN